MAIYNGVLFLKEQVLSQLNPENKRFAALDSKLSEVKAA